MPPPRFVAAAKPPHGRGRFAYHAPQKWQSLTSDLRSPVWRPLPRRASRDTRSSNPYPAFQSQPAHENTIPRGPSHSHSDDSHRLPPCLFGFFVGRVLPTPPTELANLETIRVRPTILRLGVIPALARAAGERDDLSRHLALLPSRAGPRPEQPWDAARHRPEAYAAYVEGRGRARTTGFDGYRHGAYSTISVTTPAPTVRPPSRIANRNSFSIAIGVINSTAIATLSPGITISTPAGSVHTPVTSVVRK